MVEYAEDLLHHSLHVASQKPVGKLLMLQPLSAPSVQRALAASASAGDAFGKWVRTAMCLVPLQLSRCGLTTTTSSLSSVFLHFWYSLVDLRTARSH